MIWFVDALRARTNMTDRSYCVQQQYRLRCFAVIPNTAIPQVKQFFCHFWFSYHVAFVVSAVALGKLFSNS